MLLMLLMLLLLAQAVGPTISVSPSVGITEVSLSIEVSYNETLALVVVELSHENYTDGGPDGIMAMELEWSNETGEWSSTPDWALKKCSVLRSEPGLMAWGMKLDFSKAAYGRWGVLIRAREGNQTSEAKASFDFYGFWASEELWLKNEAYRANGTPHVVEATTVIEALDVSGAVLHLEVGSHGTIVINATWGKPAWVMVDGRMVSPAYNPVTGLLYVNASWCVDIGWTLGGQAPNKTAPAPVPLPEAKPLYTPLEGAYLALCALLSLANIYAVMKKVRR